MFEQALEMVLAWAALKMEPYQAWYDSVGSRNHVGASLIERNILTIPVLDAIEKSAGCPLCHLWVKEEERLMENLLTCEVVMDPGFREKVRDAKGFCNHHSHLLYKAAHTPGTLDDLGYAIYMQSVVESILRSLPVPQASVTGRFEDEANRISRWRKKQGKAISDICKATRYAVLGKESCPACESLRSSDGRHLFALLQMLDDDQFREEFQPSKALCIPHLLAALGMVHSRKLKNPVSIAHRLEIERGRLQTAADYLSEFIRKSHWDARNEPRGPEANANSISLNLLVGTHGLYQGCHSKEKT